MVGKHGRRYLEVTRRLTLRIAEPYTGTPNCICHGIHAAAGYVHTWRSDGATPRRRSTRGIDRSDTMSDATAENEEAPSDDRSNGMESGIDEESIADLAQQPVVTEWVTFLATLFALIGVGVGLLMILGDAVGEEMFSVDVAGDFEEFDGGSGDASAGVAGFGLPPQQAMFWAIPASVLVGAVVSARLPTDETSAALAASIGTGVGTLALVVLGAFLSSIAMDDMSVEFGGVLINGVVAGIVAGGVAAAAAWVVRNRAPGIEHGGPAFE